MTYDQFCDLVAKFVPLMWARNSDIPSTLDIPTIPEILIIIQISSRLWIRKGMTHADDVCPNIPEITNIADIPNIPTIPEILIIIQISSGLGFLKCMKLGVCLSLLTFSTFLTFLTFPTFPLFLKLLIFQTFTIYYHTKSGGPSSKID